MKKYILLNSFLLISLSVFPQADSTLISDTIALTTTVLSNSVNGLGFLNNGAIGALLTTVTLYFVRRWELKKIKKKNEK